MPSAEECRESLDSGAVAAAESTEGSAICVRTIENNVAFVQVAKQRSDGVLINVVRW